MAQRFTKKDVKVLHNMFDSDKSGIISKQNLLEVSTNAEIPLSKEKID